MRVARSYPDFDLGSAQPPLEAGTPLIAMLLYRGMDVWHGLVLRPGNDSENVYERIGLIIFHHRDNNLKDTARKSEEMEGYIASLPLKTLKII